ncbi:MAG: peptidylprolyl isomerase [Pseudomonadota bacterium]
MSPRIRPILREPLVQFAAIGLVIFALDRATSEPEVDPALIRVDRGIHRELSASFEETRGRKPTRAEMDGLVAGYLETETLVREARALSLDHGDSVVRARLVLRLTEMLGRGEVIAPPSRAELEAWWQARRESYDFGPRVTLGLIELGVGRAEADALVLETNAALGAGAAPGERLLEGRDQAEISAHFGPAFTEALLRAQPQSFSLAPSPRGWHLVRLIEVIPAEDRPFAAVEAEVLRDWEDAQIAEETRAALDAIREKYPVERLPYDPSLLHEGPEPDEPVSQ